MRTPVNMKGTPEVIMFGEGCQKVNLTKMSTLVGGTPEMLRLWNLGRFPKALTIFARICSIRGLTDDEVGALVRKFR